MQVFRTLIEITKDIKGAKVENHKFCASVHYRNVEENVRIGCYLSFVLISCSVYHTLLNQLQNWTTIGQRVHDILKNYPRLRSTHGRKV